MGYPRFIDKGENSRYNLCVMKKFPFKFSPAIIVLFALISLVFTGGIVFNILQLTGENYSLPVIIISSVLELVALIFTLAAAFGSKYYVKNGFLVTRIGLIFFKTSLFACSEITFFEKLGKIVLYRKDGKFSVVITSPEVFDAIAGEIIRENPQILKSRQFGE